MKVLSLFSGIGAFEKALTNLGVDYEMVGYCELDKYASKSYSAIHGIPETMNLGDITKVNEKNLPKDIDLITYGFPCQDISLAGKQQGLFNDDGSQTRSGLFFEALRLIEETKPKIAIAENVKNLVSKKFSAQFQVVLASLEAAGYNNYWKVLNAKDYGVPQNRERVFIVSIRKDIDTGLFEFPKPFQLDKRLKDLLEENVDEKYYLSDKALGKMTLDFDKAGKNFIDIVGHSGTGGQKGHIHTINGGIGALSATDYKQPKQIVINQVGQMYPNSGNPQAGRVYDAEGISPTMDTCSGGNRMPKILIPEKTKKGYAEAEDGDGVYLNRPHQKRGCVQKGLMQTLKCNGNDLGFVVNVEPVNTMPDGTCRTIKNQYFKTSKANFERSSTFGATGVTDGLRIRKLTPKECFRLMGFDDESFHKAEAVNSNTQLYKQAGNSIVVDVLEELFRMIFNSNLITVLK